MEEAFDAISAPIELLVEAAAITLSSRIAADDDLHSAAANRAGEVIGVVAGIADESLALRVSEQFVGDCHFVTVPGRQCYMEWPTFAVGDDVKLCREASSTTTQTVCVDPPFPPAAS